MTTLKVGIASYEEMKARTLAVARGERHVEAPDDIVPRLTWRLARATRKLQNRRASADLPEANRLPAAPTQPRGHRPGDTAAPRATASSIASAIVAISSYGSIVTSAAAVMVCVFAIFGTLSFMMFKEMGVGLAFAVGVMQQPHEFTDYAELAIEAGSPGEAEQVLTSALKNNVFSDPHQKAKAERILKDAKKRAAKDQTTLADTAALAAKQVKGDSDIRVGLAYYGYKQYDKAIQMFNQGISKGGLTRPAEAHLLLGISQLKAGNKPAAVKAFNSVKGNPTLQRLAALWVLKAKSMG